MQTQNITTIDFSGYNSTKEEGEICCPTCKTYIGIDILEMAYQTRENDQVGCPLCRPDQYPVNLII